MRLSRIHPFFEPFREEGISTVFHDFKTALSGQVVVFKNHVFGLVTDNCLLGADAVQDHDTKLQSRGIFLQ